MDVDAEDIHFLLIVLSHISGFTIHCNNFLLHLVVIVVVIRCCSLSHDVTVRHRRVLSRVVLCRASSLCDIFIYRLCTSLSRVASFYVDVLHRHHASACVRSCALSSLSLYVVVVHCRRQVTKQTIAFWVNARRIHNQQLGCWLSRPIQCVKCEEFTAADQWVSE